MYARRTSDTGWMPPLIEVRSFSCDVYSVCLYHDFAANNYKLTVKHPAFFCGTDLLVDVVPRDQRGYAISQHDCWVRNLQENLLPHITAIAAIQTEADGSTRKLMIQVQREGGVFCG